MCDHWIKTPRHFGVVFSALVFSLASSHKPKHVWSFAWTWLKEATYEGRVGFCSRQSWCSRWASGASTCGGWNWLCVINMCCLSAPSAGRVISPQIGKENVLYEEWILKKKQYGVRMQGFFAHYLLPPSLQPHSVQNMHSVASSWLEVVASVLLCWSRTWPTITSDLICVSSFVVIWIMRGTAWSEIIMVHRDVLPLDSQRV